MPRLLPALVAAVLLTSCNPGATSRSATPATPATPVTTGAPAVATTLPSRPPFCETQWSATAAGVVGDPELAEISGAAISRAHPGVLWVHNDSGDDAAVSALTLDGDTLARITFPDLAARDWEDMAIGPGPGGGDYLYLGDIGDNTGSHPAVFVHRVPEPAPVAAAIPGGETLEIVYPEGPVEAESLLVDPLNGDVVILGKALSGMTPVFEIAGTAEWGARHTASLAGFVPLGTFALATGADAGPTRIVVRTYDEVFDWARTPGTSLASTLLTPGCRLATVGEPQGEAIALDPSGERFFTVSEGVGEPLLVFEP